MKFRGFLWTLWGLIFFVGCVGRSEYSLLPDVTLKAGDIVLRCGSGMTSRVVRFADDGGIYSHVGIVVDSAGMMMVVHAVPDEHDTPDDVDRIKMDYPERFFSSIRANNGCVLRCIDSLAARRAALVALGVYRRRVLFDQDYDISDTTKMYCSEFVEYAYGKAAGFSITDGRRHDVNLPAIDFEDVILPSDFVESSRLRTVVVF